MKKSNTESSSRQEYDAVPEPLRGSGFSDVTMPRTAESLGQCPARSRPPSLSITEVYRRGSYAGRVSGLENKSYWPEFDKITTVNEPERCYDASSEYVILRQLSIQSSQIAVCPGNGLGQNDQLSASPAKISVERLPVEAGHPKGTNFASDC